MGQLRTPIFIVGSPRSGTSLLRRCLNQHPHLAICSETHFFSIIWKLRSRFGDLSSPENRDRLAGQFRTAIPLYFHHALDAADLCRRLAEEATSYPRFLETILDAYAREQGKPRCGEKSPEHAFHLPQILSWFPDCRIIHIVRNPRDVVASMMSMPWSSSSLVTNARLWRHSIRAAEVHNGAPYYLRVQYESLVHSPAPLLQAICRFLEEPDFDEWATKDAGPASPYWWRNRSVEPITVERVGSWRTQLTDQQVALIDRITAADARALGYEVANSTIATRLSPGTIAHQLRNFCVDRARQRWKESVTWRLDREPLLTFHRSHAGAEAVLQPLANDRHRF